ncbi:hypothetical protein Deba_2156 [Desulfarculus baarsii DSM 2075]|uniref:Aspartate kinase n=1 Tax=Desulfarculus baarsii (strain ATCC 33931 / DSM 2075 / LMG 7858 / VKM B-1802 / 2st14) TaxID=644282 RepID=E1QIX8_DESB2|nr:hypothetical protein [Desulfarculus baarsii]ADK85521.1 hypothetical protein Deba_2156 [Desulfarculus baarsii DSM 2075]
METVAVYNEHPVKVYGVKLIENLLLLEASGRQHDLPALALAAQDIDQRFRPALLMASWPDDAPRLCFCLERAQAAELERALERAGLTIDQRRPASLIHLQGPHFGDRFGIVALALDGLVLAGVEALAVAAAVHSLFVVVEPSLAERATRGLRDHFSPAGEA